MEYKLTFLIMACAFSGSLALVCERCTNFPDLPHMPNCSLPGKHNCTWWRSSEAHTVWPLCIKSTVVYTNGVIVKNGLYKSCGYHRNITLAKTEYPKRICDIIQRFFQELNMTVKSCQTECCYDDECYSYGFSPASHVDELIYLIFLSLAAIAMVM